MRESAFSDALCELGFVRCSQRGNLEDALRKLQVMIDAAVVKVTPKEKNPEKEKRVKKLCGTPTAPPLSATRLPSPAPSVLALLPYALPEPRNRRSPPAARRRLSGEMRVRTIRVRPFCSPRLSLAARPGKSAIRERQLTPAPTAAGRRTRCGTARTAAMRALIAGKQRPKSVAWTIRSGILRRSPCGAKKISTEG